jgi:uncharacterized protein YciI
MLFALICNDKPDHLAVRTATRPDHLAYLEDLNSKGAMKFAGPFVDANGKPNGTLAVIEAQDRKAAEAIAASDPYAKAGLFTQVEIRAWNWVVNNPAAD